MSEVHPQMLRSADSAISSLSLDLEQKSSWVPDLRYIILQVVRRKLGTDSWPNEPMAALASLLVTAYMC